MHREIQELVELLGITELQAHRHVQARRWLIRSGNARGRNLFK